MAPILSLLRHMNETENTRPVRFYYGARTAADLFYLDEILQLGEGLTDFEFVACLSESADGSVPDTVTVEEGMVTDVVARHEDSIGKTEVYLCGPPPMVDAALVFLDSSSVPKDQIFYDSFTSPALFDSERTTLHDHQLRSPRNAVSRRSSSPTPKPVHSTSRARRAAATPTSSRPSCAPRCTRTSRSTCSPTRTGI